MIERMIFIFISVCNNMATERYNVTHSTSTAWKTIFSSTPVFTFLAFTFPILFNYSAPTGRLWTSRWLCTLGKFFWGMSSHFSFMDRVKYSFQLHVYMPCSYFKEKYVLCFFRFCSFIYTISCILSIESDFKVFYLSSCTNC